MRVTFVLCSQAQIHSTWTHRKLTPTQKIQTQELLRIEGGRQRQGRRRHHQGQGGQAVLWHQGQDQLPDDEVNRCGLLQPRAPVSVRDHWFPANPEEEEHDPSDGGCFKNLPALLWEEICGFKRHENWEKKDFWWLSYVTLGLLCEPVKSVLRTLLLYAVFYPCFVVLRTNSHHGETSSKFFLDTAKAVNPNP